jgi:signal transduction histidine kinase
MSRSFSTRLSLALAVLLLLYGAGVLVLARQLAAGQEQESLQRLSHGLARHIVGHWPQVVLPRSARPDGDEADQAARKALLEMLMVVNPGVHVYVLDADGRVAHYIGDPGMVQQPQVDLNAVRSFLGGAPLPLHGTDPMHPPGASVRRVFSAAMFAPRAGDSRPPGYLYVVLDGAAREAVAAQTGNGAARWGLATVAGVGLLLVAALGLFTFRRLTRPLHRLARRMHGYSRPGAASTSPRVRGDEVQAIEAAFTTMTERIEAQNAREQQQAAAHREMMAGVAHDLRTPLTALHGQLEALAAQADKSADRSADKSTDDKRRPRLLQAALAQSDKVRRLSQQLFELAALQANVPELHRERLRLDELVTDAVQKFDNFGGPAPVQLTGVPPGQLEMQGDLQLIERALTNLIDNALRHAPGSPAVRVSVLRQGHQAQILVEDDGPGLPRELVQRLQQGRSLREPPIRRASGGIGGLGLAIAQRVAQLHGGSLLAQVRPSGGTRLCLSLPVVP